MIWRQAHGNFALDLPTYGAVLGLELRKAVASRRSETGEMELHQWRAKRRSDGASVVDIGGGLWFADEHGEGKTSNVEEEENHMILDGETVPDAGPVRAVIHYSFV